VDYKSILKKRKEYKMKGFKNFMESGFNRIVAVIILVIINLIFNGYNFLNVGEDVQEVQNDIAFLKNAEVERIVLNIEKQVDKIYNDPEDIKIKDFEKGFTDFARLKNMPDCKTIVSRIEPLIEDMREYYREKLLKKT
jgi:hypothetical protein